jgi:phosphate starvation-inducible membrane PsiE
MCADYNNKKDKSNNQYKFLDKNLYFLIIYAFKALISTNIKQHRAFKDHNSDEKLSI